MAAAKMTPESRGAAQSVRAKLRKALVVEGFELTANEQKAIDGIIVRISKLIVPPKADKKASKKKGKKKASKKVSKKTASKPAADE